MEKTVTLVKALEMSDGVDAFARVIGNLSFQYIS